MLRIRYFILGFLLVAFFVNNAWSDKEAGDPQTKEDTVGSAQPVEEEPSWKYLVKRTNTKQDNFAKKKDVHIDRALVYYGAGAKQAGGQIKTVPNVVYVDEELKPLPEAIYFESAIIPLNPQKLGLFHKFPEHLKLPEDIGSSPDSPLPADGLPKSFSIFPLKPEAEFKSGLSWSCTWYLNIGWSTKLTFPTTISHKLTGYEQKMGRRCAVIEYVIAGEFKSVDHPERLTEKQRQRLRGEYYLKGSGTAYFDLVEGIIVEKDQTIYWTELVKEPWRSEEGKVGWKPTTDRKTTVTISVSLIPEEQPTSGLPVAAYILIVSAAGIVIIGLILLKKKRTNSLGK